MLSLSGELSVEIVVNDILLQTNAKTPVKKFWRYSRIE